jgi:hypothetical protein
MSILGSIMGRIFGSAKAEPAPPPAGPTAEPSTAPIVAPTPAAVREAPATPAMTQVDLAAVMEAKAASAGQTLNWRSSIVDLMKLLGLDSSLAARKELAGELGYTGDTSDSAAMNVWLHKQVMQKVAENGGQVPADLQT